MSWRRALSPPERRRLTVRANTELGVYRLLSVADPNGPAPAPGQFAMLAAAERWGGGEDERPFLPRAFSYARHRDAEAQFLLEDVGPGTRRLGELRPGEQIDLLGPLGTPFAPPAGGSGPGDRALLVGGGAGIAPLAILQDQLVADGVQQLALLGFRDAPRAPGGRLLAGAQLASDDGSAGHHGLVTELLERELAQEGAVEVYACGPAPMLESVRAICSRERVPAQLALESGMACGFGACFGCVVATRDRGYVRVCVDGPVLDAASLERVDVDQTPTHPPA